MQQAPYEQIGDPFDRQVENLAQCGYPEAAGLGRDALMQHLEPLRARLDILDTLDPLAPEGRIPFVIVLRRELVAPEAALPLVRLGGKTGFTEMEADDLGRFGPIDGLELPAGMAYLMVDVDTGRDTLDVTPDDALGRIRAQGRSPLTIDEGVAMVTHHPGILADRNSFSMLGSRCGDRRVTALWMSRGRPRLGWCWAGNPHAWLGSASCGGRLGPGVDR